MNWLPAFGFGLLGFGLVYLSVPLVLTLARRGAFGWREELHHAHCAAVPRFGGLALAVSFLAVEFCLISLFSEYRAHLAGRMVVVLGSLAMFALGFCDDVLKLGAKRKLAGQILIALGVYYSGVAIDTFKIPFSGQIVNLHGWGVLFTVVWLVGITNLLNLIDGVDGLAGGVGLILMGLLVYVGMQNGTFALLAAGMTGALTAFLWFNFPPARIYLGDGGAYFIGFQLAIFSIVGSHKGTLAGALIAPLFVLALPILDTSLAILRRGAKGLPVFRPDRSHIHHRLLRSGMSRRNVVLSLYFITTSFLATGSVALWVRGQWLPILVGAALLLLLLWVGKLSFNREWLAAGHSVGNTLEMRDRIKYALRTTARLRQKAKHCDSLELLYEDLVVAARRLGFTMVRIGIHGRERSWNQNLLCRHQRRFHHQFNGRTPGLIELHAPACPHPHSCPSRRSADHPSHQLCHPPGDSKIFEVTADLLAESWQHALNRPAENWNWVSSQTAALSENKPPNHQPLPNQFQREKIPSRSIAPAPETHVPLYETHPPARAHAP